MNNFTKNALLTFFSVASTLFVLEFMLREFYPLIINQGPASTDELPKHFALGYVFSPGVVISGTNNHSPIDKNGYLNDGVHSSYDIVALGDSHTAGREENGIREAWPNMLAKSMGLSVYNMGLPGYGVGQYRYQLSQALELHPRFVVVGLYLGNDIYDTYNLVYHLAPEYWSGYRSKEFIDDQPLAVNDLDKIQVRWKGARDFLHKHVALYGFASKATRNLRERVGLATPHYTGTTDWTNKEYDAGLLYDTVPTQKTVFLVGTRATPVDLNNKNIREGLRLSSVFLSEMEEQAAASSTKLVIALFPTKSRVYYDRVKARAETNLLYSQSVKHEDVIKKQLLEQCSILKLTCVDVLPEMQSALAAGETIYLSSNDDHPSGHGYGVYEKAIESAIARLGK